MSLLKLSCKPVKTVIVEDVERPDKARLRLQQQIFIQAVQRDQIDNMGSFNLRQIVQEIEYMKLAELQPDERNPKSHDVGTIDMSMQRFGVLDPIVLDGRTGKIISGHGRHKTLLAMQQRGDDAPQGVKVAKDGTWKVPVYTGWQSDNDSQASAALIALNRTTELGGWVDEELLDLLAELAEEDDGLEGVGFLQEDIDKLAFGFDNDDSDNDGSARLSEQTELEDFEYESEEDTHSTLRFKVPHDQADQLRALANDHDVNIDSLKEFGDFIADQLLSDDA